MAKDSLVIDRGVGGYNRYILLMRCLSGSMCFLAFVFAVKYLPLSIFFVMMNATPFLIAIIAWLWLKELITMMEVICMIGAFGGILIVAISKRTKEEDEDLATDSEEVTDT